MLLVNRFGNAFVSADDALRIEHYKSKGYTEVKVNKPAPRKTKEVKTEEIGEKE